YRVCAAYLRAGWRFVECELDVALSESGRRCGALCGGGGFVGFCRGFGRERAYRKGFVVHDPEIPRWEAGDVARHGHRFGGGRSERRAQDRYAVLASQR